MAVWIAVSGTKNVGKTSVIEQIIQKLRSLDITVSTVKHTHFSIDMDTPGTDTHRHREAGAETVSLATPNGWFLATKKFTGTTFPEPITRLLSGSDVVLCEGFYRADIPKIVIQSDDHDQKTSSQPEGPVILRTRLRKDKQGSLLLSPQELDQVIQYIRNMQTSGTQTHTPT
jgi:molybdopterin-guanine dinucleotide biosynthesis protein B